MAFNLGAETEALRKMTRQFTNKDRYVPRPYLLASGVLKMWKKITAFKNRVFNLFPKLVVFFCFYEMGIEVFKKI